MRWMGLLIGSILVVASVIGSGPAQAQPTRGGNDGATAVDLQLVLAVDVSLSMDNDEQQLQRQAYVAAFRDPLVHEAIRAGTLSRIAVIYVEWSGDEEQRIVVPWTLIDSPEAANAFAATLESSSISRMRRTSISSAMNFAARLFDEASFTATRRVIDFSGDGSNNEGPPIDMTRDELIGRGIVINGLPLVLDRTGTQQIGGETVTLEMYYEQCVIGGAGSFLVAVRDIGEFRDALKTKLILEIAAIQPDPDHLRVIPASDAPRAGFDCSGRFSF
jgi:hypothetical protein